VEEAACRVLRSLEYTGLVEVEFKFDARDGRYKILDINARPWTWIGLGAAAGVDFPYLAWQLTQGEAPTPVRAIPGVRRIHFTRDLVAACQEIWRGRNSPARYFSSFRRPLTFAVMAWDDLLPVLIELPLVVVRALIRSGSTPPPVSDKPPAAQPRPTG
jgi:predicted ATP-grasp superfamily ATP-dependent carboligase